MALWTAEEGAGEAAAGSSEDSEEPMDTQTKSDERSKLIVLVTAINRGFLLFENGIQEEMFF